MEAGTISLVDEMAGELVMRVHRGWQHQDLADYSPSNFGTGISGQAIAAGEPIVTGDVRGDPRLAEPEFGYAGFQAVSLVPMRARGKVVGVLGAMSYRAHTFTPHEVAVLAAIADQVGVALDNARLYEVESRRNAHLALINEIARQVTATLDLEDMLNRTAQAVQQSFGYFHVALYLLDAAHAEVVLHAFAGGYPAALLIGYRQPVNVGMVGYAAQHGETLLANDINQSHAISTFYRTAKRSVQSYASPLRMDDMSSACWMCSTWNVALSVRTTCKRWKRWLFRSASPSKMLSCLKRPASTWPS